MLRTGVAFTDLAGRITDDTEWLETEWLAWVRALHHATGHLMIDTHDMAASAMLMRMIRAAIGITDRADIATLITAIFVTKTTFFHGRGHRLAARTGDKTVGTVGFSIQRVDKIEV